MTQMFMYDDVTAGLIPGNAQAVAGYVDGTFANVAEMRKRFPQAHLLPIAVFPQDDATVLDVEPGDATNAQVFGWFNRQVKRGVHRPVIYTSASNAFALQSTMHANGFPRSSYRMWTAHYGSGPHLCAPHTCGFGLDQADATQFNDKALGRSLDISILASDFFDGPPRRAANPVGGLNVVPRFTEADVSWTAAKGAQGYRVVVSRGLKRVGAYTVDGTSMTLHGLNPQTKYRVSVVAQPYTPWANVNRSNASFTTETPPPGWYVAVERDLGELAAIVNSIAAEANGAETVTVQVSDLTNVSAEITSAVNAIEKNAK